MSVFYEIKIGFRLVNINNNRFIKEFSIKLYLGQEDEKSQAHQSRKIIS
jgi:hypothetical protein